MTSKVRRTVIISLIVVFVLALGAIAVLAQDDSPTPDAPALPGMPFGHGFGFRGHHGFGRFGGETDRQAELADALGITVEELEAAQQKVLADNLAQMVEDGFLTQDQANSMLAMDALRRYLDHEAIMAEALGLSVEEIEAAREDGTLFELMAEQMANTTPAEMHEKMQQAMSDALDQAVADNVITAEQAELVRDRLVSGYGMHGGFGRGHGFGGRHGFGGHGMMGGADWHGSMPFRSLQSTADSSA